jgi:hypothetical protein
MFRKAVFSYTFVIVGLIAAWLFLTLHVSQNDLKRFKTLQQKGQAIAAASVDKTTRQNRAGVRKDLWIAQEGSTRLHDRIESASSVLTLTPVDDHMEIVEHLSDLHCSMQDKVTLQNGKWVQQVRYFDAITGVYQYSTSRFTAQTVALSLFRLPGNDLPVSLLKNTPYLKGVAQDVSFAVAGKASQFQAKQFKASFVGEKKDD